MENQTRTHGHVTVYFDGLCRLCSREIEHYRKMRGADRIRFIDITATDFDSSKEAVDPVKVHKVMHVRGLDGQMRLGVDAFIAIWEQLPALAFLAPLAKLGPIHLVMEGFYAVFAKLRPLLPRKSCEASPYCDLSQRT